jgi:hypothetical protein
MFHFSDAKVEDTEYKEFQAIDVEPADDRFVIITTTIK